MNYYLKLFLMVLGVMAIAGFVIETVEKVSNNMKRGKQ